ncbi:MAG TPA: M1 family aminopeptidase [Bacteroidia bacterium]|nr:M1 family aminopeptidase [Bacteroidia bacterium]
MNSFLYHLKSKQLQSYNLKLLSLLLGIFSFNTGLSAMTSIADTFHVEKYIISIDTIDFTGKQIKAKTQLQIIARQNNLSTIELDLFQLNVDSVYDTSGNLSYSYQNDKVNISLPFVLNMNDTINFTVVYHGSPKKDASGFGGFYFFPNMAFNLGVGFTADPHNLGKVWFPCLDVFDDKSKYEFYITTPLSQKAYCNGFLNDSLANANNTITWHWIMNDYIPTYLACMATGPYTSWERTLHGIPVEIAALPTDTAAVSATFVNLPAAINLFTQYYGSYPFNKIGYTLVNFTGGAMEHATNIAIGKAFINGTLGYETLWAHELSHMWWGDKVTCKTAEDMWLNEGWASFNEALFTEAIYGPTAYKDWIRTNHRKVLQLAHITDGGYLALNNVPTSVTYGNTAYQKGADIVHTLRNYAGDSLFKVGAQHYLDTFAYSNASSIDMEHAFTSSTGTDYSRFFTDWVYTPGFPHFSIDSAIYVPGGLDHYFVYTRQRNKGSNGHIYSMPVDITFSDGITDTTVSIQIDSATQMFHIPLLMANATWIALDRGEKISDAISDYEKIITTTGLQIMKETNTTLNVQSVGASPSTVRIEHHWVQPDGFKGSNPGIRLSDYHYWQAEGIFNPGFVSKISFQYDGSTNGLTGYIDNTLITGREDSLVLLYRENTAGDWQIISASQSMGSPLDKRGSFSVDTLKKGEYVLGYRDFTVNNEQLNNMQNFNLNIVPNPAKNHITLTLNLEPGDSGIAQIIDIKGREVDRIKVQSGQSEYVIQTSKWKNGEYFIHLKTDKSLIANGRFIIQK